ncbi:MAG: DUF448 domain-containing protein [Candidatus Cloacimonetes bacterium]|nr:DUF448 domain-containing protein [Candidatus Cloacimonadota bacterium]
MPNKASHAGHIPQRTCIICKSKKPQKSLIRFAVISGDIVFDIMRKLPVKGKYVCDDNECINKLEQWKKRWSRKQSRKSLR